MKKNIISPVILGYLLILGLVLFIVKSSVDLIKIIIPFIAIIIYNVVYSRFISKQYGDKLKHNVLNYPIVYVYYLSVLLLTTIIMLIKFNFISYSINILLMLIVMIVFSIIGYLLKASKDFVVAHEEKVKKSISNSEKWLERLETILIDTDDKNTKNKINELIDEIKYSDKVDGKNSEEICKKISEDIDLLSKNVSEKNIKQLKKDINKRKVIVKSNK